MKRFSRVLVSIVAAGLMIAAGTANAADNAPIKITFWHAMSGVTADALDHIAKEFNQSQSKYVVDPVYKGNYTQTLTSAMAAFRAHNQPDILQVFEVGTATMMAAGNAVMPVYKLMNQYNVPFDASNFIPAVKGYYTDQQGHMLSMPFNSSTAVLYYNKDAFKKAGIDPSNPPATWQALGKDAKKLRKAGVPCGFTTGWQSWIQIEQFGAWNNVPLASKDNGFGGRDARLLIDKKPYVQHIHQMADWTKNNLFQYGGRQDDPNSLFYSGHCAMLFESSGSLGSVKKNAKFDFGVAPMPYDKSVTDHPQNAIIGGASLWVLKGLPKSHYKGIAEFLAFLSQPAQQAYWSKQTGYVPVTQNAYQLLQKQGFYKSNPDAEVGINELTLNNTTPYSKGLRLGNYSQIRDIINDQLEAVWSGQKSAKQALEAATKQGNQVLEQFQSSNGG